MMPISPVFRALAPFLAALVVFTGAAALYVDTAATLLDAIAGQSRLGRVQGELADTLAALADAEAEHRGFLLTGQAIHRERYQAAVAESARHLRALEQLTAADAEDSRRLQAIRVLNDLHQRHLAATLKSRVTGEVLAAGTAGADRDAVRAQFHALQMSLASREAAVQDRLATARASIWQRLFVLVALMVLMLAAAAWVMYRALRERGEMAERLRYESTHDTLCGLPNRRFFMQWMERALAQARREQRRFALLYLDLDGFRRINDVRGQEIGDRLLRVAAKRFCQTLRESDVLARVGADEFAILTPASDTPENVVVLAQRLIDSLAEPLLPQFGDQCAVGVSIGIAFYPVDGATPDQLMHAADMALQAARQGGSNNFRLASALLAPVTADLPS